MTCDNANGELDYLTNNNNVPNGKIAGGNRNGNGVKFNKEADALHKNEDEFETRKSLIVLLSIFAVSIFAMFYIYKNFPELEE